MAFVSVFRRILILGFIVGGAWVALTSTASPVGAQAPARMCGGVEVTIVGTAGDDRLVGTEGPDVIAGLQGDDQIFGLGGDDILCGGFGDDIVFGGQGFDILFGAQGDDVLLAVHGPGAGVRRDSRGARMFGGAGNDQLIGSNRWDRMQGGDGADLLMGYEGQDWIRGGGSADQIDGGGAADDIFSGWGADRIDVGGGDDVRAGLGRDHCNIDGRAKRLWSCETQVPIENVPFGQQVDGGHFAQIEAPEREIATFDVFEVRDFDVEGVPVSVVTNLDALPDRASVVAFNGLVIDNGGGAPEACIGAILDSLPPGCGGPLVDGLDFHPSWADYFSTTRLGSRALILTWPPVDGTVTLIEDRGDHVFTVNVDDDDLPGPLPIPDECADIETFVNRRTMLAWAQNNPDRAAGVYSALGGPVIVVNVVGDPESVRAELRTADAEPCVLGGADFSTAELTTTRDELRELRVQLQELGASGWGVGARNNRVNVTINVPDAETVAALAELVTTPEHLRVSGGSLYLIE